LLAALKTLILVVVIPKKGFRQCNQGKRWSVIDLGKLSKFQL